MNTQDGQKNARDLMTVAGDALQSALMWANARRNVLVPWVLVAWLYAVNVGWFADGRVNAISPQRLTYAKRLLLSQSQTMQVVQQRIAIAADSELDAKTQLKIADREIGEMLDTIRNAESVLGPP